MHSADPKQKLTVVVADGAVAPVDEMINPFNESNDKRCLPTRFERRSDGHLPGDGKVSLVTAIAAGLAGGNVDVEVAVSNVVSVDHDVADIADEQEGLGQVPANQVDKWGPVRSVNGRSWSRHVACLSFAWLSLERADPGYLRGRVSQSVSSGMLHRYMA